MASHILWVAGGIGAVLFGFVTGFIVGRRNADVAASKASHEAAQNRPVPVQIGDTYEVGVIDISTHHSGEEHAVGKVEGFVVFVEDIPKSVSEGDVVLAKVMALNKGETSATATFVNAA